MAAKFIGKPCRTCGSRERYCSYGKRCVRCALTTSNDYKRHNKAQIRVKATIYREQNAEKIAKHFSENKDAILAQNKAYYERTKADRLAQKKEYYYRTKATRLAAMRKYRQANPDKLKVSNQVWAERNKERLSEKRRRYQKENATAINARAMARHCKKLQRMPPWADSAKIKAVYQACPKGMHVDHIIPLQGELVSGLHVPGNLQYLSPIENCQKSNNFEPLFISTPCSN